MSYANLKLENVAHLPAQLLPLVEAAAGRSTIRTLTVCVTTDLASLSFGYSADKTAVTAGEAVEVLEHHWTGSDGESNTTVTYRCNAPTARANKFRGGCHVIVEIGGVSEVAVNELSNLYCAKLPIAGALAVALDESLGNAPVAGPTLVEIASWNHTVIGGTAGTAAPAEMVRATYRIPFKRLQAPKAKRAPKASPASDHEAQLAAAGWI